MTATATAPAAATERVPFMDLAQQWRQIEAAAMPELRQLFEQSAFVLGPWVDRFEKNVAAYTGVEHAVGVNSGTSALHLAMIAAGVGPGDKVLLPANTFMATAWGVLYVGAEPVLCDVFDAEALERAVRSYAPDLVMHQLTDEAPLAGPGHDHLGFNDWVIPVCFENVRVTPLP